MDSVAAPLSASAPDATEAQPGQVVVGNGHGSSPGARCQQTKASGGRCAAYTLADSVFCFFHDPATAAARAAARRAGGQKHRAAVLPATSPDRPLGTVDDVVALLGETINHVRRGALDPKVGTAVGYLAGLLLKALEQGDLAARLAVVEAAVETRSRR